MTGGAGSSVGTTEGKCVWSLHARHGSASDSFIAYTPSSVGEICMAETTVYKSPPIRVQNPLISVQNPLISIQNPQSAYRTPHQSTESPIRVQNPRSEYRIPFS